MDIDFPPPYVPNTTNLRVMPKQHIYSFTCLSCLDLMPGSHPYFGCSTVYKAQVTLTNHIRAHALLAGKNVGVMVYLTSPNMN